MEPLSLCVSFVRQALAYRWFAFKCGWTLFSFCGARNILADRSAVQVVIAGNQTSYFEERFTIAAIGSPMQNTIITRPIIRPESGTGLLGTFESGITTKFMKK